MRGFMSKTIARLQFDFAWSLYQKGIRGSELYRRVSQFAHDEHLPNVYYPPMHCVAEYVRDNPSVSPEDAIKGTLLAVEFSPDSKGLQHHVIQKSAYRAGLTDSPKANVTNHILEEAKRHLRVGSSNEESADHKPQIQYRPTAYKSFQSSEESKTPKETSTLSPDREQKKIRFIQLLKNLTPEMKARLQQEKTKQRELEKPDFIWHFILQSFSTMGNSRGYQGLILNKTNYQQVTYEALTPLTKEKRRQILEQVFRAASLRMAVQKAEWAAENHDLIASMGGPIKVKQLALSQKGTKAKIAFMKQFHGIGDKYARNIWMDVYHPDFRNSIAVDERIKDITKTLGYSFSNYEAHEQFYLDIANEVALEGWELDRLLYNFKEYFLSALDMGSSI